MCPRPAERFYRRVLVSRTVNVILLGRWETVCARVHRRRWIVAEVFIDCCFAWKEIGHCRAMHDWEAGLRIIDCGPFAATRMDDRVRLAHTVTLADGAVVDVGRDLTINEALALASRILREALGR